MTMLVTGASGRLGRYVLREARKRNLDVAAWSGRQVGDLFGYTLTPVCLEDLQDIGRRFEALRPHVVLHIAAMANVNQCYRNPGLAEQINVQATSMLAGLAAGRCRFVHLSTDMVFGGDTAPYRETDPVAAALGLRENQGIGRTGGLAEQRCVRRALEPALRAKPW